MNELTDLERRLANLLKAHANATLAMMQVEEADDVPADIKEKARDVTRLSAKTVRYIALALLKEPPLDDAESVSMTVAQMLEDEE